MNLRFRRVLLAWSGASLLGVTGCGSVGIPESPRPTGTSDETSNKRRQKSPPTGSVQQNGRPEARRTRLKATPPQRTRWCSGRSRFRQAPSAVRLWRGTGRSP
jgi:hypothetical protein